ncbi:RibD family protein [Rubrobacter tropicus]|uniref:RibD family protein n=1 Tax=Rubrobacter tropicus TaxID=2653851 RepID=UPI001D193652|nr:RibD family protein [Rubrobacter tropicus]
MTVSYAQTLDGRLATLDGSSQWISAPDSLCFSHELRASHDAVMVGVGTVIRDDPRLTVRLARGENPLRIVVDSSLRTPTSAAVLAGGAAKGTVLAVTGRAAVARCGEAESLGATVLRLPPGPGGGVDLGALLRRLDGLGVRSVMVEGGATLITALLREELVDRLAVCVAPKILGAGIEAVGDLGIRDLARSISLTDVTFTPRGGDLLLDGRVEYPADRDEVSRAG